MGIDLDKVINGVSFDIKGNKDESSWNTLIEQVIQGNVIPVVCPGILLDNRNLQEILVQVFIKKFNLRSNPLTFSELIYDPEFLRIVNNDSDAIYSMVNQIFNQINFPASDCLKQLLSIKQFPFVITTSYAPIVENEMRHVWKNELKVYVFNNNPAEIQDVNSEIDLRKPGVFYMMGKVGSAPHRYVLTDMDMLDFCSSWVADTGIRPKNLVNILRSVGADGTPQKYLLLLGNNYSDWLFRFIWYSIRKSHTRSVNSCYASCNKQDDLALFLERNHAFMCENPAYVISEIQNRLSAKLKEAEHSYFNRVHQHIDIFISYSRSDLSIALQLYQHLTNMGKRVWFDKNDITSGGVFKEEINRAIDRTRYFVPIFTSHIEDEKNSIHVYRQEWRRALNVQHSLGRTYIIPIAEKGIDYYNSSIPEELRQRNVIEFDRETSIEEVAKKLVYTINQE